MNDNSMFLINEMLLINKAVAIKGFSSLMICEIIRQAGHTLRAKYYNDIIKGDFVKPLGYINSLIDGGF